MTDKGVIRKEVEELSRFIADNTGEVFEPQKPGEITIKEFMEATGASYDQANSKLNRMVGLGLMEKRKACQPAGLINVYWKK